MATKIKIPIKLESKYIHSNKNCKDRSLMSQLHAGYIFGGSVNTKNITKAIFISYFKIVIGTCISFVMSE